MYRAGSRKPRLSCEIAFFAFGALLNLILWRSYLHISETQNDFVDARLTSIAILALGGCFGCLFLRRLLRNTLTRVAAGPVEVMAKAGLYGMMATACTFESFFLVAATYGAIHVAFFSGPTYVPVLSALVSAFVLFFMDIQLYGVLLVAWCLPYAFVLCSFPGIAIWQAWRQQMALQG
jgi:hypothetical protein